MSGDEEAPFLTGRWAGLELLTLVGVASGVLLRSSELLLASAVGVGFLGYARVQLAPSIEGADPPLSVTRRLEDTTPAPGRRVTVTIEVENTGSTTLFDLRLSDGVPAGVTVVGGSPDHATALRPGATDGYTYTVGAHPGEHVWEATRAIISEPSGSIERSATIEERSRLHCVPSTPVQPSLPVDAVSSLLVGRVASDSGGAGVEFHSTRDYRPGDPLRRVDWHRFARTNELGTLNFRRERQVTVVLVIDARGEAYLAPHAGTQHAVERAVEAAERLFEAFLDQRNKVGLYVLGRDRRWLPPGMSRRHRVRGLQFLGAFSSEPPEDGQFEFFGPERRDGLESERLEHLASRLPDGCAPILISPCCDPRPTDVARFLRIRRYPVTVLSPDPTVSDTAEHALARSIRGFELRDLRRDGIGVIDWPWDEPLAVSINRTETRWSR